ncbi:MULTISPECIES: Uma2 family endonuclease [Streptomyces]|uniref:Endonuclease, Uma2 family (Restriction endonuclease fold) n=2 Tax=Streptomyces TaxID=1883 RepID=A0A1I6P444_9ACTN|nr:MULTISPECIES: Uma2 family endonuclease [Streptomyces]QKV70108.1 Uma2 family endonuclease [Streptomyces harbinensis]SFS34973.1 Endonuclease, Uma2 family (restriction endonuclease fold) [Streptomyces harbinensis]
MSAAATDFPALQPDDWPELVRNWEELDVPPGYRAEIIDGKSITLTPPPSLDHAAIASLLHRQLVKRLPEEYETFQNIGVAASGQKRVYIPDLVVALRDQVCGPERRIEADEAELIVEITSPSNANHDRINKAAVYAAGGVPLYLLVDALGAAGPMVTLFGSPVSGVYRTLASVKFGEPVLVPEPLGLELDTSSFPS